MVNDTVKRVELKLCPCPGAGLLGFLYIVTGVELPEGGHHPCGGMQVGDQRLLTTRQGCCLNAGHFSAVLAFAYGYFGVEVADAGGEIVARLTDP